MSIAAAAGLAHGPAANAATYTWDVLPGAPTGNSAINDGAGGWNNTSTNYVWTNNGGVNNVAWVNNATAPNSAIFGGGTGAAGTVTVTTVNAQDITFNAPGSGTYTLSGSTITLGNTTAGVDTPTPTITANVAASIGSSLAGNDGLIKSGSGNLTLTGKSNFTGGTTVSAGTLTLSSTSSGIGTLQGVVTVSAGATLASGAADSLGYTPGSQVTTLNLNGGTFNNLQPANSTGNQGFSTNVTLTAGTLSSTGGGDFFFNSGFGISSNAAATSSLISTDIALAGSNNLQVAVADGAAAVDLNISGIIYPFVAAGNTPSLTKTGAGTLQLSNSNTYTGATTVNAGTLSLNITNAIFSSTSLNVSNSTVISETGFAQTIGNTTLNNGGKLSGVGSGLAGFGNYTHKTGTSVTYSDTGAGGPGATIDAPEFTLQGTNSTHTFTVADGAAVNDLLVSSNISNATGNSGNNISKAGPGTLVLSGTNSYGTTTISAGTLQIGNGGTTGTLGTGAVTNNAALVVNRSDSNTISNAISGSGTLTQAGAGTTILIGSNSYDSTTISAGTLQIGSGGTAGTLGSGAVTNNAALVINRSDAVTITNAISGTGTLTQNGAGITTLSGSKAYTGATNVNAGTLRVNGSTSASSTVTVASTATLGGTGTVGGAVTVQGGGHLAPGSSVGTLTVGSLALAANSIEDYEFNTTPANDYTNVTTSGGLTINGGKFNLYNEGTATAFAPTLPSGHTSTYNLIGHTGAIGGTGVSSLSVNNPTGTYRYIFSDSGTNVQLTLATQNFAKLLSSGAAGVSDGTATVNGANGSYQIAEVDTDPGVGPNLIGSININGNLATTPEAPVYVLLDINGAGNSSSADAALVAALTGSSTYGYVASDHIAKIGDAGPLGAILTAYSYLSGTTGDYDVILKFDSNPSGGSSFQFDYNLAGVSGVTTLSYVGVVPEPSTIAVLGLGGLGAFASRRRRRGA